MTGVAAIPIATTDTDTRSAHARAFSLNMTAPTLYYDLLRLAGIASKGGWLALVNRAGLLPAS
jgi:hypothetical protein